MNRMEFNPKDITPGILIYMFNLDGNVQNGRFVYKK